MAHLQEPNPFFSSKFHIHIDVHTCTLTGWLKAKGKWGPNCCKECSGTIAGHYGMVAGWLVQEKQEHLRYSSWLPLSPDVCARPWTAQRVAERTSKAAQPRILFLKLLSFSHNPARKGRRPGTPFPFPHSRKQGFLLHGRNECSVDSHLPSWVTGWPLPGPGAGRGDTEAHPTS